MAMPEELLKPRVSPEQYLEMERKAPFKSEYINGQVVAMSGASIAHIKIAFNLGSELRTQLKGKPCEGFGSDLKVYSSIYKEYYYPDLTVLCDEAKFLDDKKDVLLNPKVIIEIISSSTEKNDRGDKYISYKKLNSLTDYILVSQKTARIEHFMKQENNQWLVNDIEGLDSFLEIKSIDCKIALSEIYDRVEFSSPHIEAIEEESDPSNPST